MLGHDHDTCRWQGRQETTVSFGMANIKILYIATEYRYRRITYFKDTKFKGLSKIKFNSCIGLSLLCQHNFEYNRSLKASSIMLAYSIIYRKISIH